MTSKRRAAGAGSRGRLRRVIGLPALVFYGVGTMVGGGLYALLGEVAAESGILLPLALGGAGLLALLSGLSFGELASRFPVSAGEARYVKEAFGGRWPAAATAWLVSPRTGTPLAATAAATGLVLLLALFFPLTDLAQATSFIILLVFAAVNLALWRIKGRDPDPQGEGPRYPRWLPLLAFTSCAAVLAVQTWSAFWTH